MRAYKEDFTHPSTKVTTKDKILYDEREWRSVKYAERADYLDAAKNKFLPLKYNLTFSDSDVVAILLKDQATLELIKYYLSNNKTLLDPTKTIPKLFIIDDYKEK